MIRKLKTKFVFTNMLLVTVVLLLSFVIIYFNSANELYEKSLNAMRDVAESNHERLDHLFKPDPDVSGSSAYISTYIIDVNETTNSAVIDGFGSIENLTEDNISYINALINAVYRQGSNEGVLNDYNMRFLTAKAPFGKRIVLLDMSYEKETLAQLLLLLLLTGTISFVAFLIISVVIAHIAVAPVERSVKQQRQLIADISHELKTPLTVIATNADIVMSHSDETVGNESQWLGYIKDETERMKELLNMMLYLAKSDESTDLAEMTDVNLSNVAFEVTLPFESVCFENGKSLEIDVEPDVFAHGNETALRQIIVILLDNAIKYSNENGRIALSVRSVGDKAEISVFNTGEPIPKEAIPHLFERFFRVEQSRTREKGGSGLGLSIAKSIVEKNEGRITVSSSMEHGTVFTCVFKALKQRRNI